MNNIWKRSLSFLLAFVMVFSMVPTSAFADEVNEPVVEGTSDVVPTEGEALPTEEAVPEASETTPAEEAEESDTIISEDIPVEEAPVTYATSGNGWYWEGSTLYIKDGKITKGALYTALHEKIKAEKGGYKYDSSNHDSDGWFGAQTWTSNGETAESSSDTGAADLTEGTWYIRSKGGRTSSYSGGSTTIITVKHYFIPTVTVTGKDGVTASNVTAKVISGGSVSFTLPAMGEEDWTARVKGLSDAVSLSKDAATTVTVPNITSADAAAITVALNKATIYNVNLSYNSEYGVASIDKISGINGDTVTVTATPNSPSGAYGYYLVSIAVDGEVISGNTFTINGADVNVVVTFGRNELEVIEKPEMEINGYHTGTDYSARFNNIKANILAAVLKNGYTNVNDYNLHIWIDPIAGDARYFNYDDSRAVIGDNFLLTRTNPYRFPCADFGDTVFSCNLKVKIIDNYGRTVEATIAVTEKRQAATITPGSIGNATFDNLGAFLEGIKNNMTVVDGDNKNIDKSNVTVSDPVKNADGTYTVTAQVKEAGPTWLPSAEVSMGPYTFKYTQYTATFVDTDGSELYTVTLDNESTPVYAGKDTAVLADEKDTAEWNYTFKGWDPAVVALNGSDVTYTATYSQVKKSYTVKFYDYDGKQIGETQTVNYGEGATAPAATQTYKTNTDIYTFKGWDVAFDNVVKNIEVNAQYSSETRYYTVTFKDYNGDVLGTSDVEYGKAATAPADPARAADKTYTYAFAGWDKAFDSITADGVVVKATYTPTYIDYTITWVYNGKTETETYHYGDAIVAPNATDYVAGNTTYTFKGWDANGNGEAEVGETLPATVTENITYKAIYTDLTVWDVTVDFDNGDDNATGKVENGKTYTIPAAPTKGGYRFLGWEDQDGNTVSGTITITENTTITAKWVKIYKYTYSTKYGTAPAGATVDVNTVITIADLLAQNDLTDGVKMTGWYINGELVTGEYTITGDVTIVAKWESDKDNDNIVDGSEADPYWTVIVDGETVSTTVLNGEYATPAAPADKANMFFVEWNKTVEGTTITFTSVWNTNDENDNNIDDSTEKFTITWVAGGKTTTEVYTYGETPSFKGSTDKATANYIQYTFTGWDATPSKVVADVTYTAQYSAELLANNGAFTMNGYYEAKANMDEIIKTLKADVLNAAGLNGANAGNYTVTMKYSLGALDLDKLTGWTNALNATAFFTAIELPESGRQFTITDNTTGVSKTVTMKIVDSRAVVDPTSITVSEQKDLGYMTNDNILADVKAVVGDLALGTPAVSAGNLPENAGDETSVTYTVKFDGNETYQGATITITYEKVYKAYNDCLVSADSALTANGSLTVNGTAFNGTDAVKVPGNSDVTVTVKPQDDKIVESITVNGQTYPVTYNNQSATVTFKSDGANTADEYVVSATYSDKYLNLVSGTIVYCVDDKNHSYDLQKLVFDAIYDGSSAPMNKDNVKLEFNYWTVPVVGTQLWADVSKDPSISLDGVTHKFGESGSETIKLTYNDAKYGKFEQTVVLNVFDSCYSVTVGVNTVTNGADATIKTQFSQETRNYQGVNYFKAGTSLTVTLTPDGNILNVLEQLYNGTYNESMAYIKSVTVTDKNGNVVPTEMVRDQGKLNLGNILQGVNPLLYNAAVTFELAADEAYTVTVEYGILELERQEVSAQMEMYKGGDDYAAKVPSAQDIVNKILGKEYAANFLATYGGAFTVEFSTDMASYNWNAVSEEALLALNDGATVRVRITWKANDGDKTYYPVAQQADLTLVDLRTPTAVEGTIPERPVAFPNEAELISELKEKMGLGITADGSALDVDFTVTYTMKGNETDGFYADVTVTYGGSSAYKPTSKTFENVPVENRPDDATIKVTIQNASDVVTNNDGKIQALDPATGIYTVIGNGTYGFKFTPNPGYAIESATVNGVKVELSYSKQTASFSMVLTEKEHYEVVVETVRSVWVLEDERFYDFATGVMTPDNSDILDAAVSAPTDIDYEKVDVEYMAREEGTVTVTLPNIDLGFTVIELGTFDIDLGELWLNPEETVDAVAEDQLDKILEDLVDDMIQKAASGELNISKAREYVENYIKGLPLGIHAFGVNGDGSVETIRFSYEDEKYLLAQVVTDVTIRDYRTVTELVANDCAVTFGYSLEQLIEAAGAYVAADGAAVEGLVIETNDLYKHAGEQTVTLFFKGDANYQPSKVTINVTVNKAPCSIDYDSQIVTYGDAYDLGLVVSPTVMPDGTAAEIDLIEFMIGLDMHKLLDVDIEDKNVGINEAIAYIQLRLPKAIRDLPLVGQYLQGEFTLGEFTEMINGLSDALGIDENSVGILNQVFEAITGVTDNMEIKVIIKDEDFHPTNIGVYVAGAVTIDADFETAYTADYLIIKPQTIEAELAWDYVDENGIYTLPIYNEYFKDLMGAHVVETETMTGETLATANGHVKYLILGVNDETSEFLTTDVYGNIKANIWTSPDAINDNGAYVQIAYMLNWGNEIYYAMPIVRSFVIVPGTANVEIVDANDNGVLLREFDNTGKEVDVVITDNEGNVIVPDAGQLTVYYTGVQTNTTVYEPSTEAPVHAGAYVVTALYVDKDENGNLVAVGADVATLIIEPTESTVNVDNEIVTQKSGVSYILKDELVTAGSTVAGLTPDTTIISAQVNSDGSFSENGWAAVQGNVNVDFPRWMDALLAKYVPGVVDGMTAGELKNLLTNKLPDISAELVELGATEEMTNALSNLVENVNKVLAEIPDDITLTFYDKARASAVGAYAVVAVVTDSDHYPSVDAGILVITPDVDLVHLKWNHEDENKIWTRELLKHVDLLATAYDDPEYVYENAEATAKITYQFIGINKNGEMVIFENVDELVNGAYVELAYIELELDGEMIISDLIARELVIVPGIAKVTFVDETGAENNDRVFIFDNEEQTMDVQITVNGEVIVPAEGTLTFTYAGVQTNGMEYFSNNAPVHAGIYTVIADYVDYGENGSMGHIGTAMGVMAIEPAASTIAVTGDTVTYDGNGHTAEVVATGAGVNPDYTLISGGAYVSGNIDEVGVDAFHGNVNIDFPRWLDAALAEHEFKTEGVDTAYLIDFIGSYRDDLVNAIPVDALVALEIVTEDEINGYIEKLDAYIDELLAVLDKLPKDVALTFDDDVTYTEPGYYFYYGIVTDSDHYPSTDTGLLVIEKKDIVYDLLDTTVTWDGEGHMVDVNNPNNADAATVIVDRENNTINILVEQDAQYLINTLARILDVEFDGDVQMSTIIEKYNGEELAAAIVKLIAELETLELPEEIRKVLTAVKAELETLPANGTVIINGQLPSEVGEYEVYAITYSEYYKTAASEAVLEIVPVRVEVILDDNAKVYGEADPELTYTVNCYDHEGNVLADKDAVTVNVAREVGENVGTYAISAEVILDEAHYVLIAETEDAVFEITPAEVTITLNNQEKTYGDADPELTYTVDGLVNGDTAEDLNIVVAREAGENAGTYAITASASTENYIVTIVDAELTITKAKITVTMDDQTKVYGEADPTFTYTIDTAYGDEFMLVVEQAREAGEDAGTYEIKPEAYVFMNDNFDIEVVPGTLTIAPAEITVTVNSYSAGVDDVISEPTYTFDVTAGVVTESDINLNVSVDVPTNDGGQNVAGEYTITVDYTKSDNWNVTVVDGKLTVELGDYVCWNMQTGKYYWIVAEALAEAETGHTVQMLKDTNEIGKNIYSRFLSVAEGVSFDLNTKKVTVDYVVGYNGSHIYDSGRGGMLIVPSYKNLILSTTNTDAITGRREISLWTGEGYMFGSIRPRADKSYLGLTETADLLTYKFELSASREFATYMQDNGTADNYVSVLIRLTWDGVTENSINGVAYQNYVFTNEQVHVVANGASFKFTLTDYQGLSNLKLTAYVVTESGVEVPLETLQITE